MQSCNFWPSFLIGERSRGNLVLFMLNNARSTAKTKSYLQLQQYQQLSKGFPSLRNFKPFFGDSSKQQFRRRQQEKNAISGGMLEQGRRENNSCSSRTWEGGHVEGGDCVGGVPHLWGVSITSVIWVKAIHSPAKQNETKELHKTCTNTHTLTPRLAHIHTLSYKGELGGHAHKETNAGHRLNRFLWRMRTRNIRSSDTPC